MSCSVNRWGKGTTCERPSNSEAAKELQARIAAMSQERAKQDMMWTQSSNTPSAMASAMAMATPKPKPASSAMAMAMATPEPEPAAVAMAMAAPATKRSDTR
jgi:hypothetical protein